jgi:predicted acyl esterase
MTRHNRTEFGRRGFLATTAIVAGSLAYGAPAAADAVAETDVRVESSDGRYIAATVYEPAEPHADGHPAVVMTHGYGGTRSGLSGRATRYAANGYVALAYDSRGFGESEGTSSFNGPQEVTDARRLIDWLADRDTVYLDDDGDPRVGMDGGSYGGGIQLNVAAADDRLAAIIPRITWHDLNQAAAPNGVIKATWDAVILAAGAPAGYRRGNRPTLAGPDPRIYEFVLEAAATNEVPERAREYFRKRSKALTDLEDIDVPTLLPQSWTDNLLPPNQALSTFEGQLELGRETALVLFPGGGHDEASAPSGAATFLEEVSLAWLDRHVHPRREADAVAPVAYHVAQPDRDDRVSVEAPMRTAATFPPETTTRRTLDIGAASPTDRVPLVNTAVPTSFRGPTGSLVGSPSGDAPGSAVSFDFTAAGPLEVVGRPDLRLPVEAVGGTAHLFVTFEHVADGTGAVINEQVTATSVPAGDVKTVELECIAIQRRLAEGERLRVTVSTTDNGYFASREAAGVVLHTGDAEASVPVDSATADPLVPTTVPAGDTPATTRKPDHRSHR